MEETATGYRTPIGEINIRSKEIRFPTDLYLGVIGRGRSLEEVELHELTISDH